MHSHIILQTPMSYVKYVEIKQGFEGPEGNYFEFSSLISNTWENTCLM